ncbi:MAG: BrnT family toxin [Deltaproteobacteria bacterium]|nr:BrnT family toxin [Deltaproteobacteria bacterium]
MKFEWDEKKSLLNKEKHGIDFEAATQLWVDKDRIEIQTAFPDENRSILIARIENKLWASIFTERGDATRIISVRRARKKEAKLYEQKETG